MSTLEGIIIKPIITEKSLKEAGIGRYTFLVKHTAGKKAIKRAIEELFDVNVRKVFTNIVNKSEVVLSRYRRKRKEVFYKKARVVLAKDQKIPVFEEAVKEK